MSNLPSSLGHLPAPIKAALVELRTALVENAGDALAALVVHGSAVRGDYAPQESDVDVLVVLSRDDRALLESMGQPLLVARASARIECIILHRDELAHSADVFPLLFTDVKQCHALMHGTDVFQELVIHESHVRLRVEQELRDMRIRLRRLLAEHADEPGVLGGLLRRKVKQLRSPLGALMAMRGEAVDAKNALSAVDVAARVYGKDLAALRNVHERVEAASDALAALLDAAIADVDARGGAA